MTERDTVLAGAAWLQRYYKLHSFELSHRSFIGSHNKTEILAKGHIEQTYGRKYAPAADTPIAHWEFALKYDDVQLPFFKAVLTNIPDDEIAAYICSSPTSKFARKTGFLFEFLTGKELAVPATQGNYADLLDEERYITGPKRRDGRWRLNNNLLGNADFCPMVRRTGSLNDLINWDIEKQIAELRNEYSPETLLRAINYLYTEETRSSYEIEHEKPSHKRIERFIALLQQAGQLTSDEFLKEQWLTTWQNAIVDPRFAAIGFRDFQNYIGQSLPNFLEYIHYICPPPQYVPSLMEGLAALAVQTQGLSPLVRAAIIAFGFVFIHPFEDGNGRLHRFLIHDMLVRDKVVQDGMILPVSAHILSNMKAYDAALEAYSAPALKLLNYSKDNRGEITVLNPEEVEAYYRYPDLTHQTQFLSAAIRDTVHNDLPAELLFIQHYDELKREIQELVDMPDKAIDLMILFLYQNKGIFPKRRRKDFPKLSDEEIAHIENSYQSVIS